MTRFIRLWNLPQGGSFNFRFQFRIQLIASNLSWLVYFASLMEDELRGKTDTICITISLPADVLWGSFVMHAFISLGEKWMRDKRTPKDVCGEANCDTNSTDRYNSRQVKILCFLCRDDVWKYQGRLFIAIYDLVDSTDSTVARVVPPIKVWFFKEERSCCCRFNLSTSL